MRIRKIQFAPVMRPLSRHPCTIVRKDFMFSPGQLELEAALDKQVNLARERRRITRVSLRQQQLKFHAQFELSKTENVHNILCMYV